MGRRAALVTGPARAGAEALARPFLVTCAAAVARVGRVPRRHAAEVTLILDLLSIDGFLPAVVILLLRLVVVEGNAPSVTALRRHAAMVAYQGVVDQHLAPKLLHHALVNPLVLAPTSPRQLRARPALRLVDLHCRLIEDLQGAVELRALEVAVLEVVGRVVEVAVGVLLHVPTEPLGEEDGVGVNLRNPVVAEHSVALDEDVPRVDENVGVLEGIRGVSTLEVTHRDGFGRIDPRVDLDAAAVLVLVPMAKENLPAAEHRDIVAAEDAGVVPQLALDQGNLPGVVSIHDRKAEERRPKGLLGEPHAHVRLFVMLLLLFLLCDLLQLRLVFLVPLVVVLLVLLWLLFLLLFLFLLLLLFLRLLLLILLLLLLLLFLLLHLVLLLSLILLPRLLLLCFGCLASGLLGLFVLRLLLLVVLLAILCGVLPTFVPVLLCEDSGKVCAWGSRAHGAWAPGCPGACERRQEKSCRGNPDHKGPDALPRKGRPPALDVEGPPRAGLVSVALGVAVLLRRGLVQCLLLGSHFRRRGVGQHHWL
mmetsp:Transcript_87830/g.273215  ORF Transcript_87830/g.273215 Transcript_87830/m.273215 type:complete len:535 (-) Transcript_87830:54-1658(-)